MVPYKVDQNDRILSWIIPFAVSRLSPKRIILFGSRAKEGSRPQSDYDLAFFLSPEMNSKWSEFELDCQEKNPTLAKLDLIRFDEAGDLLKSEIMTGVVVYESEKSF